MKWQNPRNEKMKRILRSDWLPERARWAHFPRSGFPVLVPREKVLFWMAYIGPVEFFAFFIKKTQKRNTLANTPYSQMADTPEKAGA